MSGVSLHDPAPWASNGNGQAAGLDLLTPTIIYVPRVLALHQKVGGLLWGSTLWADSGALAACLRCWRCTSPAWDGARGLRGAGAMAMEDDVVVLRTEGPPVLAYHPCVCVSPPAGRAQGRGAHHGRRHDREHPARHP